jgi:Rod binding domain-containing protein
MSEIGSLGTGIPTTAVPAEVQKAGDKATETYKAALGFEQMLVKQLTKQLTDSTALGGDGGDSASSSDDEDSTSGAGASPSAYRDMVADQMAASMTNAGGMGIAQNLYQSLMAQAGDSTTAADAATSTDASSADAGTGVTGANDATTTGGTLS